MELSAKVERYRALRTRSDALSKELEAVKGEINDELTAAGVDEVSGDGFKVSRVKCERTSFDWRGFSGVHPRLFKAFSRVSSFMRLSIV